MEPQGWAVNTGNEQKIVVAVADTSGDVDTVDKLAVGMAADTAVGTAGAVVGDTAVVEPHGTYLTVVLEL